MPTPLSNYQMKRMQATQNRALPDLATVKRPTKTRNSTGGQTLTWTNAYTNIPCMSESRVLREIKEDTVGGIIQAGVRWVAKFAIGTVIMLDDVITVTEGQTGRTYSLQVTSELSPQSFGTVYGVQCIRIS